MGAGLALPGIRANLAAASTWPRSMSKVASPVPADAQAAIVRGDFAEAECLLVQHLSRERGDVRAWHLLGNVQIRRGNLQSGLASYDRALALDATDAQLWYMRGVLLESLHSWDAALQSYDRALKIVPNFPLALAGSAKILISTHRHGEAIAVYKRGLALSPSHLGLLSDQAQLLSRLGQFDEALALFQKMLLLDGENRDARNGCAICLQKLGRLEEALPISDGLAAQFPDLAYIQYNRGTLLNDLRDFAGALCCFDKAIALQPDIAEMHNNRGHSLRSMCHLPEALIAYERALSLNPNDPAFHHNRGLVLIEAGDPEVALKSFEEVTGRAPQNAEFLYAKATALEALKRFSEALTTYQHALAADPGHDRAFGGIANVALCGCDWQSQEWVLQELPARMLGGRDVIPPFILLGYGLSEADQLEATKRYRAYLLNRLSASFERVVREQQKPKLKLGYVSADFHEHATTYLITGLIETHDRGKFDVHGICTGPKGLSKEARRLQSAFDAFHDVRFKSDEEIAALIRGLKIDILVDLKGYTQNARPGIFARHSAPVQISWLGYPATSGSDDLDYLIADRFVLLPESEQFYTEKVIRLPTCYQANDDKREIGTEMCGRRDLGLPEDGFVFCCFNSSWKIRRHIFEIWMRLLIAVKGSVLWLLHDNEMAKDNLLSAAADYGVSPERLVFAPRVPVASHLARHRHADLFLDTVPYNAHTGAADALWAGLPLLTCTGNTFPGRVATSLLHAAGLPELICGSLGDYEVRAIELARNGDVLNEYRARLHQASALEGLFDTKRFASELEAAYQEIWRAHRL
jgi:protein O-GlcNAc transferase